MSILIGGTLGGMFRASVRAGQTYDPVYDTPMDLGFLYNLLPDFYRTLMEDTDIFSLVWSGIAQATASDMLHLWTVDAAKSLKSVPLLSQRKWVYADLWRELDLTADPGLESSSGFAHDASLALLDCTWLTGGNYSYAWLALGDTVTESVSVAWSVTVTIAAAEQYSASLFGYFRDAENYLRNVLCVGLFGSTTTSDEVCLGVLHSSATGEITATLSSVYLEVGNEHRVDASYTARTGILHATIYATRATKLSGTTGSTLDTTAEIFTNQFEDAAYNFDTEGVVVGDTLRVFDTDFEIVSVDGSVLTVKPIGLHVDNVDVAYEIRGSVEQASCTLNVPGEASDPTFTVDRFGTGTLDYRALCAALFTPPAVGRRRSMTGSISALSYVDPTLAEDLLSVPRLQNVITEPGEIIYEGVDYWVSGTTLQLQDPPTSPMWAEYAAYDEYFVQDNFGLNVDLEGKSTAEYKAKVRGIYSAYFQGPTISALRQGVHLLVGLPIADSAGTVESINPDYSGVYGLIRISDQDYLYPLSMGTTLQVDDTVALFEPLCAGVEILDYLNSPEWFVGFGVRELLKYHTFVVRLRTEVFDNDELVDVKNFIAKAKPSWVDTIYVGLTSLEDILLLGDDIGFSVTLSLYDSPTDGPPVVAYDDAIYEGEDEVDWKYDAALVAGQETTAAMRGTSTPLGGYATFYNGNTGVTGFSSTWLADLGGPGPVANVYLGVGRRITGTAGESTAGSHEFNEATAGAFTDVQALDIIDIVGEGAKRVIVVHSPTRVVLDSALTNTATGVGWVVTSKARSWYQVGSVAADDSLTLASAFAGVTAHYAVYLLDYRYMPVHYDQFLESCIDEEMEFTLMVAPTAGTTLLTGRVSVAQYSTAVEGDGTLFLAEIGGPGPVADSYLVLPSGVPIQVVSVTDGTHLTLSRSSPTAYAAVCAGLGLLVDALNMFTFTTGSNIVAAAGVIAGVNAGDWVQSVWTQDILSGPAGNPVVQVLNVVGANITLTAAYTGATTPAGGAQLMRRGTFLDGTRTIYLPETQRSAGAHVVTGWFDVPSSRATSILAEPEPYVPALETMRSRISFWLDANHSVLLDSAGAVSEWVCRVRTGVRGRQATPALRPTFDSSAVYDLPAVVSVGGDYLTLENTASFRVDLTTNFYLFAVIAWTAASGTVLGTRYTHGGIPGTPGWALHITAAGAPEFEVDDGVALTAVTGNVHGPWFYVVTIEINGAGQVNLYENGVLVAGALLPGPEAGIDPIRTFSVNNSCIAEVALLRATLSAGERAAVEADLMTKYNLP